ncbi:hypothetical protein V8B55DRAFT_1055668 [Mucor lusitanicus]|uniref:Uncharacterized protein n=2 Tax=Mucor circinelloides f. lusitanicus TaxID=29924 RepID=A0A168HV33_MUCCL|nr:hypothetical protein FB192DRAFT_1028849 [Mucor lusitanicus]OAC99221.1 hypothetical protein MUCCIDRAFT_114404 [Mucor lusitanicus CBS 277.49]
MSTRTVSVKSFNNNIKQSHSHAAQLKPIASVSKATKTSHHTNQQQQPSKKKLQATSHSNKQQHQRRNQKKANVAVTDEDSSSSSSSSSEDDKPVRRNKRSNYYQQQQQSSYVDQVYAGPTFNNAPAPSALPIPAFNARGSPINYPQPLYHSVNPSLQQQSMDLMNLITPQKVVNTAYELEKTNLALSEIQRGLRSMLKIES